MNWKSKPYNGYKNWQFWNVSLWINNDEGLYTFCRDLVNQYKNKDKAARAFMESLNELGIKDKTPDGAKYTISAVRAAMVGM